jgi:hypothetical protein
MDEDEATQLVETIAKRDQQWGFFDGATRGALCILDYCCDRTGLDNVIADWTPRTRAEFVDDLALIIRAAMDS